MPLFAKQKRYKVLFVASEAAPYVQVGGLGEVMRALPKALRKLGYDARVMIPKYGIMDVSKFRLTLEAEKIDALSGDSDPHNLLVFNVLSHQEERGEIVAYFLENMEYFEKRANVYGYADDTARWVFLSKGVLEFLRRSEWVPDIIVAADWQTGFIPNLLRTEYKDIPVFANMPSVFSIHNIQYQGMFDHRFVSEMDFDGGRRTIPDFFDPEILKLNGMRRGIMYADVINTVSPTYAKEILTPEFGEGLNELLNERKMRLFGILNGIDYGEFDPATEKTIPRNYTGHDAPEAKRENKRALQKQFGLPENDSIFVAGILSRMSEQKGFDLITQTINPLFESLRFQLIVLGSGDPGYQTFFQELRNRYPERVGLYLGFTTEVRELLYAGADVVLLPSRFEPCGLVQMEAMRYGTVPVVRKVGGLADSVSDFDPATGKGTGFVFEKYDPMEFLIAFVRAYEAYRNRREWKGLVRRTMRQDFSWEKSAEEYGKLFRKAIELRKREIEQQGSTS